jgi:hypothetical protein
VGRIRKGYGQPMIARLLLLQLTGYVPVRVLRNGSSFVAQAHQSLRPFLVKS